MRSVSTTLFVCLSLVLACSAPPQETSRDVPTYTIEQFLDTVSYDGASFSPDGRKILVRSDRTGIWNAWALPVEGGEPQQLSFSETDVVIARSYFPNDERFVYESDQAGNELDHVFVQELDGSATDITPGVGHKARFVGWADDDASFFIETNERDQRYFDLYEVVVDGYERRMLYREDTGYEIEALSPDKRRLALQRIRTTNDSDLFVYDLETGGLRHLTPHEGDAMYDAVAFSADGTALFMLTNEANEFARLVRHDLATDEREVLVETDWDVTAAEFSEDRTYLVVSINADGRTDVRVYEAATMTPVDLPRLPEADIPSLAISPDERRIAMYMSRSRNPRDLYVVEIGGDEPRQLTRSLNPAIDPQDLVDPQVVRFSSHDGVEIPGILFKPHQVSPERPAPALVWVHGGPGGQSRVGYSGLLQYLVNHGYVVYAINNRGSSGYGKTFYALDDRRHGEADLDDCVASKRMLIETGYVDPQRIGIIGGSYGGYMVLAALAFRPDAFAAGVDVFGVANWPRTLESMPKWWESFREALFAEMGDPAVDGERLRRISPLFHAENIDKPLLVLQGANDPRVLKIESDEIVEAVRGNGVPVEYVVFDDEGHGFSKKTNRLRGYRAVLEFLDEHLKPVAAREEPAG